LIGCLLHFARRPKYPNRDVVEEITEIDLGRNAPTETGIFSPEDLRKLLDHCPEDLIAPLAIGAFCGLRTSELGRLDWLAVDLASGFIRIEAKIAKTATRRLIPIPDNLRAWLEPIAKGQGVVFDPAKGLRRSVLAMASRPSRHRVTLNQMESPADQAAKTRIETVT
jgi:integrase